MICACALGRSGLIETGEAVLAVDALRYHADLCEDDLHRKRVLHAKML